MDVKQLPELTVRELVNYGRPLIPAMHCAHCALPVDCTCQECAVCLGHAPTMQERIENDSENGWDDWTEHRQQIAERREVMLEGMV